MLEYPPSSIADCLSIKSKDLIFICDEHGIVLNVNECLTEYLKLPTPNIVGMAVKTLFSVENKKLCAIIYSAICNKKQELRFKKELKHTDGSISTINWQLSRLQNLTVVKGSVPKPPNENESLEWKEKFKKISKTISDCFFILDKDFNLLFKNETASNIFASAQFKAHQNVFFESFPETTSHKLRDEFSNAVAQQQELQFVEFSPLLNSWFSINVLPFGSELHILTKDISDRVIDHKLNELELKTFEMKIEQGLSFPEMIKYLLNGFENLYPHLHISVLKVKTNKLWHVAAPSLPLPYSLALDGLGIGPNVGSCGSAAYLKKNVITFDIDTDEKWVNHKHLILPYKYQSCWSFPILSSRGQDVMATVAFYSKEKRIPTESESKSIARLCNIIKIFFEDLKQDDLILLMNNRYQMVTMATNDAIYDWDLNTDNVYWSENLYNIFGFTPQEAHKTKHWWINHVHHEDRAKTLEILKHCLRKKESGWTTEYRLKCKDGCFKYVYNRGYIIYDHQKRPVSIIGAIQDVTRLKEREVEIINQNNKLKEIAQISSHDLRRPVTSILGLASLFNSEDPSDENNKVVIDYLQSATKELDNVIHTIVAKTLEADYNVLDVPPHRNIKKD